MVLKRSLRPAKPKPSLTTRALQLIWRNPRMAHTLLREEYRKKFGIDLDRRFRDGLSGPPVSLNLHLTRRCNLSASCASSTATLRAPPGSVGMTPAGNCPCPPGSTSWIRWLPSGPGLYLTGGEPTLYPHFAALLTEAKQRGLVVHLQTNGTLLDRMADTLVAQGWRW